LARIDRELEKLEVKVTERVAEENYQAKVNNLARGIGESGGYMAAAIEVEKANDKAAELNTLIADARLYTLEWLSKGFRIGGVGVKDDTGPSDDMYTLVLRIVDSAGNTTDKKFNLKDRGLSSQEERLDMQAVLGQYLLTK
jgi:hypothetical protein